MDPEKASFSPVPTMTPTKTPNPARSAFLPSFPANSSPANAPMNAPIIIPQGGNMKTPNSIPAMAPTTPDFDAPYFFAPPAGTT